MSRNRIPLGPYSRTLQRGAVGASIDGRSREGRFLRAFERQLVDHVGGKPSMTQRMMISRLARVALRLELFDEKLSAGELTEHDARVYGALHGTLLRGLRELGLKAAGPAVPSLPEYLAQRAAERAQAEEPAAA